MDTADSTGGMTPAKSQQVTKPKAFTEQLSFLVKEGTSERIEAVRGEVKKADFLRAAIDAAIARVRTRTGLLGMTEP